MRTLVDLNHLSADDLSHLAGIKREQERLEAEERTARLAEVMWKPALGHYRKAKREP
jgi:hypothetical protein